MEQFNKLLLKIFQKVINGVILNKGPTTHGSNEAYKA